MVPADVPTASATAKPAAESSAASAAESTSEPAAARGTKNEDVLSVLEEVRDALAEGATSLERKESLLLLLESKMSDVSKFEPVRPKAEEHENEVNLGDDSDADSSGVVRIAEEVPRRRRNRIIERDPYYPPPPVRYRSRRYYADSYDSDSGSSDEEKDADGADLICSWKKIPADEWLPDNVRSLEPEEHSSHVIHAYYKDPLDQAEEDGTVISTQRPLRIMINSRFLASELEDITGAALSVPIVILPPCKMIFLHWDALNERLQELSNKLASQELATGESSKPDDAPVEGKVEGEKKAEPPGKTSDENPGRRISRRRTGGLPPGARDDELDTMPLDKRVAHLKLLIDFFNAELQDVIWIRARIRDGTLKKIAFEDLWHLFSVGDMLYDGSQHSERAYQLYAVTGGRRTVNKRIGVPTSSIFYKAETNARPVLSEKEIRRRDNSRDSHGRASSAELVYTRRRTDVSPQTRPFSDVWTPFCLDCFSIDFDGAVYAPCYTYFTIYHFPGERDIRKLDVYPMRFHPTADEVVDRLADRGRKFTECHGHRMYDGTSFTTLENIDGDVYVDFETRYKDMGFPTSRGDMRVLRRTLPDEDEVALPLRRNRARPRVYRYNRHGRRVPHETAKTRPSIFDDATFEDDRAAQFAAYAEKTLWRCLNPDQGESLEREQLTLLPPTVPGYVFQFREWHFLHVNNIHDIDKSDAARFSGWDDLVIPPTYRELLVSLVENHASGTPEKDKERQRKLHPSTQMDPTRGKGRGLIILLHGPPGAGKTSTAETIAAYTHRPLYSMTVGDVGSYAETVERNLQRHFQLAQKWGCVLLLDEADVYLMKRDWHDIERNSLVSIFLRILEYYRGILFLTTNRVGVIDEAFKSRIHVSLRYPSLDLPSTKSIWERLLNRIERDNRLAADAAQGSGSQPPKIVFNRDELMVFAEQHFSAHTASKSTWNGRQIRNAFQTAIALGQYDRIKMLRRKGISEEQAEKSGKEKYLKIGLTRRNFKKIANTAKEFEDYMSNVRGSDVHAALDDMVRDDGFVAGVGSAPARAMKNYGTAGGLGAGLGKAMGSARPSLSPERSSGVGKGKGAMMGSSPRGSGIVLGGDGYGDEDELSNEEDEDDSDSDGSVE
ncbi:hypothetical protein DL771_001852 [Monosporascus sp. 5C6A]|nr:hypothetical protein DL771_001852 [Monosporascus sp. 5C6A]